MTNKRDEYIGKIYTNTHGTRFKVVEYYNVFNVTVNDLDNDCTIENVQISNLKRHKVKSPYDRTVYGIGCIGYGKHKATIDCKNTKAYETWKGMMKRCYDKGYQEKYPTYIGCTVCEEWHNFQVFADWFEENYYEVGVQRMALDKDILNKGNKVYSPDNCVFTPQRINSTFVKRDASRGDYYIGVAYNKLAGKYMSHCRISGKQRFLGYFSNKEEAFNAYKIAKENEIKRVADEYKDVIPDRLYKAMYTYKVDIDD